MRTVSSPRTTRLMTAVGLVAMFFGAWLALAPGASAVKPPDSEHKVTICHRTNAVTNPYVMVTVDFDAADGSLGSGANDHTHHYGPVFDFTADPDVAYPPPHNGDQWGDIIPPYGDGQFPGYNWTEDGQAVYEAGCAAPTTTTSSSSTSSSSTSSSSTSSSTSSSSTSSSSSVAPTVTAATTPTSAEVLGDEVENTTTTAGAEVLGDVVTLPRTGDEDAALAAFGVGLLAMGAALVGVSQRRLADMS